MLIGSDPFLVKDCWHNTSAFLKKGGWALKSVFCCLRGGLNCCTRQLLQSHNKYLDLFPKTLSQIDARPDWPVCKILVGPGQDAVALQRLVANSSLRAGATRPSVLVTTDAPPPARRAADRTWTATPELSDQLLTRALKEAAAKVAQLTAQLKKRKRGDGD
jgi:hypothetical protein